MPKKPKPEPRHLTLAEERKVVACLGACLRSLLEELKAQQRHLSKVVSRDEVIGTKLRALGLDGAVGEEDL